jgi:hypothetical protein
LSSCFIHDAEYVLVTALALVLDGSDDALLPRVDELRQGLDAVVAVPLPCGGGVAVPAGAGGAEVRGAELLGEAVEVEVEAVCADAGVVRVDEAEVVPERMELVVVLAAAQRVVRLAVTRQPEVVRRARLRACAFVRAMPRDAPEVDVVVAVAPDEAKRSRKASVTATRPRPARAMVATPTGRLVSS